MNIKSASILILVLMATAAQGQTPMPVLIRDVRVFDGERVLEHRSILIEQGRITVVGAANLRHKAAEIIDGRGQTLMPGFIDAHVHVANNADGALRQALELGVTTVFDMFTVPVTLTKLKRIEVEDPPGIADVRTAGIGASAPGGHPAEMGGPALPALTSAAQAQAFVDARIAEGSDYIKIIYDDLSWGLERGRRLPMLTRDQLNALIQAAHNRGKLAIVHIHSEQQARDAIEAGADGLAHMFMSTSSSNDLADLAAEHHIFIISTLSTLYASCGMADGAALLHDPHFQPFINSDFRRGLTVVWHPLEKAACTGIGDAMRRLSQAHVPVLAGTDAPVPGTTYGVSLHGELARLVEAGYTPTEALASATSVPARTFHLTDRGLIRRGMRADLVLVEGDPTRDIFATRNIVAVFKKGMRVR
jgi:imidazolonepropionase-like amidohydrolase